METEERKRSIEELATALSALVSASDAFDEALGKVLGLNPTDVRCVDLLDKHGTITAGALADLAGLSTGAVTFLLDRLERAGFVSRVRDLDDRRRVLVELVPLARRQISELHKGLFEAWWASAKQFSGSDLRRMIALVTEGTRVYEAQLPLLWSQVPTSHKGSRTAAGRAAIKEALKAQARAEAHDKLEKTARKLQAKANELHEKATGR
jgi:DNA-binding MarR family transcriptional regulator